MNVSLIYEVYNGKWVGHCFICNGFFFINSVVENMCSIYIEVVMREQIDMLLVYDVF